MANNIKFTIELENGQYKQASNEVIKQTEKIEKQSKKSYASMDNAGQSFARKFKRYFSFAALFGGMFLLASKAIGMFFNAFSKGVDSAIKKNERMKKAVEDLKTATDAAFEKLGEKALPALNKLMEFANMMLNADAAGLPLGLNEKELRQVIKNIGKAMNDEVKKAGSFSKAEDSDRYQKLFALGEEAGRRIKVIEEKRAEENKKRIEEEKKARIKAFEEAQASYNNSIKNLSDQIYGAMGADPELKKQLETYTQIGEEINNIVKSLEQANKQGKDFELSGASILGIITILYGLISSIGTMFSNYERSLDKTDEQIEKMNEDMKTFEGILNKINTELRKINAELRIETSTPNTSTEAIQDEIDLLDEKIKKENEVIKTKQDQIDKAKKLDEKALKNTLDNEKGILKIFEDKVNYYKNDLIGQTVNLIGFGMPLKKAEAELEKAKKRVELAQKNVDLIAEIPGLETDIKELEADIFDDNLEINELIKQRNELLNRQSIETGDLEDALLKAKKESVTTDEEKTSYINQIIDGIEKEIIAYQNLIAITENKNDSLVLETEMQEHLNEIADLRKEKEELIAQKLQKQVDILKKYVDLGLDLENIRVVRQLARGYEAQGYTGVNLGSQLQNIGVSNRALNGKILNIYGDINNTLNQASPSAMMENMNNLINKIGGV